MNNLWVNDLINQTIEKDWCTQFFCTTCGAGDFKGSLRRHLDSVLGTRRFGVPFVFNSNDADVILEQLKSLKPIDFSDNYPREWVIMFLLYISWQTSPSDETRGGRRICAERYKISWPPWERGRCLGTGKRVGERD